MGEKINVKIIIPGNPIPKARHRSYRLGKFIKTYDPQDKEKKALTNFLYQNYGSFVKSSDLYEWNKETPLSIKIKFLMPIPKSDTQSMKNQKAWGLIVPTHKPDISNMLKFYEDVFNQVIYHDDSQVVHVEMDKLKYSEKPRTEIEIMEINSFKIDSVLDKFTKIFSPSDLKEFITDVHQIASLNRIDDDMDLQSIEQGKLSSTASLLIEFSKKYESYFKKLNKI